MYMHIADLLTLHNFQSVFPSSGRTCVITLDFTTGFTSFGTCILCQYTVEFYLNKWVLLLYVSLIIDTYLTLNYLRY